MKFKTAALVVIATCVLTIAVATTAFGGAPTGTKSDMGHDAQTVHAPAGMKVRIKVRKDKMKGYNLFISTKRFRWAPEHASGKHRRGEGHAHLMLDGKKLTRLYGSAYYLGDLAPGTHSVQVTLNANDHRSYAHDGKAIESTVKVTTG